MERVEIVLKNTRANWQDFTKEVKSHLPKTIHFVADKWSGDLRTMELQNTHKERIGEVVWNKDKSIPFVLVHYI